MEFYCIDRLEEGFAVCETPNDRMENIPLEELPPDAAEGDLLRRGQQGQWEIDHEATQARREAIRKKRAALKRR